MRNFILGTDWWTDCDDVVALRVLTQSVKNKKINLSAIIINACMELSAASVDGFLSLDNINNIPIGIDFKGTDFAGKLAYYQEITAPYATKYKSNSDAEDAVKLYRRILSEAKEPIEIIEIGFLQCFAELLQSEPDEYSPENGVDLVRKKVKKVWVMAGKWDEENGVEHNFANNARSRNGAFIFCEKCPVPVTFLGFEIGVDVITGDALDKNDHLYKTMFKHNSPNGRNSWDPMTALLAVIGDEEEAGYDFVTGKASVNPDTGENTFIKDENGLHKYVIKKFDTDYYKNQINSIINLK